MSKAVERSSNTRQMTCGLSMAFMMSDLTFRRAVSVLWLSGMLTGEVPLACSQCDL